MTVGTTSTKGRMVKITDVEFTENGTYIPSENNSAFGKVKVNVSSFNPTTLDVTPTTSEQTFTPMAPYNSFNSVTVNPVTASIDDNITPENIKRDITILGVTGAYAATGSIIFVTNNSSVDRFINEKVWIRQTIDGWEIIDWGSVDITCLSGKCETNINMGETGNVILVDDGIVINHLIRDFTLSSGLTESNVNDDLQTLTIDSTVASSFIYKQMVLPTSLGNHIRLKVKYKIMNTSGLQDVSDIATSLACCGRYDNVDWQGYAPSLALGRKNNDTTDYFIGRFAHYEGGLDSSISIYKSYTDILHFDTWITMYIDGLNVYSGNIGGKFTIIDPQGNEYVVTNASNASFVYERKGIRIGNNTAKDKSFNIVYDLSQCGIFDTDNNSPIWTPYTQRIV